MLVLAALLASLIGQPTTLGVTVWPQGTSGARHHWTLHCDPAGGTVPRPARACSRLATQPRPFAPVPRNALCTAIYGGPAVALVTGTYRGRRIWTRFQRRNGCEIARWGRVGFLFPVQL
jgi:hypothetical protein